MDSPKHKQAVRIWSWTASLLLHGMILASFAFVGFSDGPAHEDDRPDVAARISSVKQFLRSRPVLAKPNVVSKSVTAAEPQTRPTFSQMEIFDEGPLSLTPQRDPCATAAADRPFEPLAVLTEQVREETFFGTRTNARKICYVVDCSGSMKGLLGQVKRELKKAVKRFEPDQYFYLIFFGGGYVFEVGEGRLLRATEANKILAECFINSIQCSGRTNAMTALEQAMTLKDETGDPVSCIYFLSDGFDLGGQGNDAFARQLESMLSDYCPQTMIHTIGFWPQQDDRDLLETVASVSGGRATFIEGED